MASEEAKVYPGNLERWKSLRAAAEAQPENSFEKHAANVAAELAGLAYILDGIRYAARKGN